MNGSQQPAASGDNMPLSYDQAIIQFRRQIPLVMNSEAALTSTRHGFTQHKRTHLFEAHFWKLGKQHYIGGWSSSDHSCRAHDLAIIKSSTRDESPSSTSAPGVLNYSLETYKDLMPSLLVLSFDDTLTLIKEYARSISPSTLARVQAAPKQKISSNKSKQGPRSVNSRSRLDPPLPQPFTRPPLQTLPPPSSSPSSLVHRPQAVRVRFHEPSTIKDDSFIRPSATASTLNDHDNSLKRRVRWRRLPDPSGGTEMHPYECDEPLSEAMRTSIQASIQASFSLHLMKGTISAASRDNQAGEGDEEMMAHLIQRRTSRNAGRVCYKETSSSSEGEEGEEEEEEEEEDTLSDRGEMDREGTERVVSKRRGRIVNPYPPLDHLKGVFEVLGSRKHPRSADEAIEHERLARGPSIACPPFALGLRDGFKGGEDLQASLGLTVKASSERCTSSPPSGTEQVTLVLGGSASAFSPPVPFPPPPDPHPIAPAGLVPAASPPLLSAASPPMTLGLRPTFLLLSASRTPMDLNEIKPILGPSSLEQLSENLTDLISLWN